MIKGNNFHLLKDEYISIGNSTSDHAMVNLLSFSLTYIIIFFKYSYYLENLQQNKNHRNNYSVFILYT